MAIPSKIHIQGLLPSLLNGYFEKNYGEYYHVDNWNVWVNYHLSRGWTLWYWDGSSAVSMFVNSGGDEGNLPVSGWEADNGSFDDGGMIITDYSDIIPYKPAKLQVQGFEDAGDGMYYSTWSGYARLGGGVAILYKNDAWVFEDTSGQTLAACPGNPWVFPLSGWSPAVLITESAGTVTISTVYELQGIQLAGFMDLAYVQTQDIDASPAHPGSGSFDPSVWTSAGFNPIGTSSNRFVGRYDGQGFAIHHVFINRPTTDYVALFGVLGPAAAVKKVVMKGVQITANSRTAALAGLIQGYGRIEECSAAGTVVGRGNATGGLVGSCEAGLIRRSRAAVDVSCPTTGRVNIGGFAGFISSSSSVLDCYARGSVAGGVSGNVGGFVGGYHFHTRIERCYSTGQATGANNVGQFSGNAVSETVIVRNCYWVSDDPESTSFHGQRLSVAAAKDLTSYVRFNTLSLWNIDPTEGVNDGYPYLDPRQAPQSRLPGLYRSLYRKR